MYSLDVAVWKGKRSEKEAAIKKAKQQQSAYGDSLPRVAQDKKIKQIYGKTMKEMHEAYLSRVDHWLHDAPSQNWTKGYDKETYSKAYIPRERQSEKHIGGPTVKIGSYSPRGVYKGGGKCVRQIVDPKAADASALPRELYKARITNFEKTREKHKEIHPPMSIPKNKPLTCAKYFVTDVICCANDDHGNQQHGSACRKCAARCPSPERHEDEDARGEVLASSVEPGADVGRKHYFRHIHSRVGHGDDKEPQPTAEYVASPQWRVHNPQKWVGRDFSTTIASTSAHTATRVGISGKPYTPSLLIADRFVPANRSVATPASAHEHERRAKAAAATTAQQRSPQRAQKKYFNSMWSEPAPPPSSPGKAATPQQPQSPSRRLGGRELVLNLREQTKAIKSPPKLPPHAAKSTATNQPPK